MNSAADALATIRARLAELESRAVIRRTRDAERNADPTPAPKAPARSGRKAAADEPAMANRNWLSEAREDLLRVDMASTMAGQSSKRRIRPSVAPEYASEASSVDTLQPETTENRTEPTTKVGGNADGAAAGNPEEPVRVEGAISTRGQALAGQGAKSPAPIRKQPQARAEHWTVRRDRIDRNALRASFAPPRFIASPYDLPTPVRDDPRPAAVAGCGPPGW